MAGRPVQSGTPLDQPTEEFTLAANPTLDADPELETDPEMKIRYIGGSGGIRTRASEETGTLYIVLKFVGDKP